MTIELLPLPRPFPNSYPYSYTGDQMQAYARACVDDALERAAQREPKRPQTCLWSRADDDTDMWETACGSAFTLIDGTPADNQMSFCCYCGRGLVFEIGDGDADN